MKNDAERKMAANLVRRDNSTSPRKASFTSRLTQHSHRFPVILFQAQGAQVAAPWRTEKSIGRMKFRG
jgi:hypothetical protein